MNDDEIDAGAGDASDDEESHAPQEDDIDSGPALNHAQFDGTADNVLQAGSIMGNVHFHGPRSVPSPTPAQLPSDVRGFVNRVADLSALDDFYTSGGPVCAIIGTAGVGKSSLAVHWAHRVRDRFPDGQLHIDLHGHGSEEPLSPTTVLGRFLESLGVTISAIPPDRDSRIALYRTLLAGRTILILLDNAASTDQIRPLLPGTGACRVLVTSRNRLALGVRDGVRRLNIEVFPEPEAVELLSVTFGAYRSGDNAAEISELAQLCGRLPLALRIAAERAASRPLMPLGALIQDLRDESAMWDALTSEDAAEAEAVRTVFAWSYRALGGAASRLFRLLGLHPGPDFATGAAAALAGVPSRTAAHLLDELVGAHMVEQLAVDRYRLHDLLRAYAAEQVLDDEAEEDRREALVRVLDWYRDCAVAVQAVAPYDQDAHHPLLHRTYAATEPMTFNSYAEAMTWFRAERANLVAAVETAERVGLDRHAWHIPAALSFVYANTGYYDDWFTTGRAGLAAAERDGDLAGRAALLATLGMACKQTHRLGEASEYYYEALNVHRNLGDPHGEAWLLDLIGFLHLAAKRLDQSQAAFQEALALCRAHNFERLAGWPNEGLGCVMRERGDLAGAIETFGKCVEFYSWTGDAAARFGVLLALTEMTLELDRLTEADQYARQALEVADSVDSRMFQGQALLRHGDVLRAARMPQEALARYQKAATIQRGIGDVVGEARAIASTSTALRDLGRHEEAEHFERWAAKLRRTLGLSD